MEVREANKGEIMKRTIGLSLALMIGSSMMGCTTTDGNANLRNANSNTGYLTSSPTPMATSTPVTNYNSVATNSSMNANHGSNMNSAHNSAANTKTNSNTKGNSNH